MKAEGCARPIVREEIRDAVQRLEPLPPTVARLAALLSRPEWDMNEVEECIRLDQGLTPKLLRIANSALWFRGHAVATVRDAVVRLGSSAVIALGIGAGVQRRFSKAVDGYDLREGELWTHSVASLLATTSLHARLGSAIPAEAATCALLHDLGKLVISRVAGTESLRRIGEHIHRGGLSHSEAECDVLGLDHAALGGIAAVHWTLPERIVTGISFHHAPLETPDPIACVVHVADVLAHRAQASPADDEGRTEHDLIPEALDRLALRRGLLDPIEEDVREELADVLRRYS